MLEAGDVAALLEAAPWGLSRAELMLASGTASEPGPGSGGVRRVVADRASEEDRWILDAHWQAALEGIVAGLATFHAAHPDEPGPDVARLRRIVAPGAPERAWLSAVEELAAAGRLRRQGAWLQLPEHGAGLSAREREAAERLVPFVAAGGFDPYWVRDLAVRSGEPEARVRQLLAALGREGRAYKVVRDLYYSREAVEQLAGVIERLAREQGAVQAAAFRDALGIGRKRAIQILEFFDRIGYTRRLGDTHVLRPGGGWRGPQ
jgi:selenocysteine-specific elongation factor